MARRKDQTEKAVSCEEDTVRKYVVTQEKHALSSEFKSAQPVPIALHNF